MVWPCKPLIGIDLMRPGFLPDLELLLGGVDPAGDPLSGQSSAHVVVLAIDRHIATSPDGSRKGLLVHLHEPAVGIDGLWHSRQGRELLAGHTRRLVATGTCEGSAARRCNGRDTPRWPPEPARECAADAPASIPEALER
jgi:hypothetical protein